MTTDGWTIDRSSDDAEYPFRVLDGDLTFERHPTLEDAIDHIMHLAAQSRARARSLRREAQEAEARAAEMTMAAREAQLRDRRGEL